jgi:hypothetical protein
MAVNVIQCIRVGVSSIHKGLQFYVAATKRKIKEIAGAKGLNMFNGVILYNIYICHPTHSSLDTEESL